MVSKTSCKTLLYDDSFQKKGSHNTTKDGKKKQHYTEKLLVKESW